LGRSLAPTKEECGPRRLGAIRSSHSCQGQGLQLRVSTVMRPGFRRASRMQACIEEDPLVARLNETRT
jgi:hypothetical protein